ncbi:MAG: hypothetical protein AAB403_21670 [Planctomycetota bacterium]
MAVGDHPDPERCKFLIKTRVLRNWPSQWHSSFPNGYIEFSRNIPFADGTIFDLRSHTINGKQTYIFRYNYAMDVLCRRCTAINELKCCAEIMQAANLVALAEFVMTKVAPDFQLRPDPLHAKRAILANLQALSLLDLESLVQLAKSSAIAAPIEQRRAA